MCTPCYQTAPCTTPCTRIHTLTARHNLLLHRTPKLNTVMSLGTVLQPSYPIVPVIAPFCTGSGSGGGSGGSSHCIMGSESESVWATHTSLQCGSTTSAKDLCHYFTAVGFGLNAPAITPLRSGSSQARASAPAPQPQCGWISHADKSHADPGRCKKTLLNTTRQACCDACYAASFCDAYVRDPSTM